MAKKKVVEEQTKQTEASQADMDAAFIEGKSALLGEFLKEHGVAIQPILEYTQYGIRPNARLVKYDK